MYVEEGLKEFFGYGKAIRVSLNGKFTKDQMCFDDHGKAFIDALLKFDNKIIEKSKLKSIINSPKCVVEVYTNSKLGKRDKTRRMTPVESAKEEIKSGITFIDALKEYGQNINTVYEKYYGAKQLESIYKYLSVNFRKIMDKYPDVRDALIMPVDGWCKRFNSYEDILANIPTFDTFNIFEINLFKYNKGGMDNSEIFRVKEEIEKGIVGTEKIWELEPIETTVDGMATSIAMQFHRTKKFKDAKLESFDFGLLEAAKLSVDDKVIYTDQVPKSLYEYYYNKYTEKDMLTLINNIKMDYDLWDKTENLFQTSSSLQDLAGFDIAVLYKTTDGNMFIYSFATEKYYYYNLKNPDFIDIKQGMDYNAFMEVCKRDFEALLRTPYGNKFVTESSVIQEGLKEIFGYGSAIRISLNGKFGKDQYCYDEFTYGCIDALLQYNDKLIEKNEFERLLYAKHCTLEVYKNSELGPRGDYRRNTPDPTCIDRIFKDVSFHYILDKYYQDTNKVYNEYYAIRQADLIFKYYIENLKKGIKKFPELRNALTPECDMDDIIDAMKIYRKDMFKWYKDHGYMLILAIDGEKYSYSIYNKNNGNVTNRAIVNKLKSDLYFISVDAMKSIGKKQKWEVSIERDGGETEYYRDDEGKLKERNRPLLDGVYMVLMKPLDSVYINIESNFTTNINEENKTFINDALFEYFVGVNYETYKQDLLRARYNGEKIVYEVTSEELDNQRIDNMIFTENFNEEIFMNTLRAVNEAENRSVVRKIAHKVKDGVDAVSKAASTVSRNVKSIVSPLMTKTKNIINSIQKSNEDADREEIITDSNFVKLANFCKRTLLPAAGTYLIFGPWKLALGVMVKMFFKTNDLKMRKKILSELELELKLTREKIEDARGDANRKAKYDLIRLESKLESEIERIKNPNS